MSNNWKNADNIKITLLNQDKKIKLNENHNGKVIFIDDNNCEVLDKNYINDKNNNLSWRHIFSYLDSESIERIMNEIQRDCMKTKILKIRNHISFTDYSWGLQSIVGDVYDCNLIADRSQKKQNEIKREILEKENWIVVEHRELNDLDDLRRELVSKNVYKINEDMWGDGDWRLYNSIRFKCMFRKANGVVCGKNTNSKIRLLINEEDDKKLENYCNLWIHGLDCCGTHYNQYDNLKTQEKKYQKIESTLMGIGYKERNGIMCKVCS
jgi:hypothetical protein